MIGRSVRSLQLWLLGLSVLAWQRLSPNEDDRRDRGDVPGWVMITVMTAIVVIALLVVFKQQVQDAVGKAFGSVNDQYGQ